MRLLLCLLVLSFVPAPASAETWLVFPVRAKTPPPRDPTMLRMSVDLAKAISDAVPGHVRLAKREERDEACPLSCPSEIALMLHMEHVVSLELGEDMDELIVGIFEPRRPAKKSKIPCDYGGGRVACDEKALAALFRPDEAVPPPDDEQVRDKLRAAESELLACGDPSEEAEVRFRVWPDGRVSDVRIEPRSLQLKKPYRCMARVVESLRVAPFSGDRPLAFRMPLPKR